MLNSKTSLLYSSSFSTNRFNILSLNQPFLEALQAQGSITIEASEDEDVKFNGLHKSFLLADVKYLNTLVVDSKGAIIREGRNQLKVEVREPETHEIFRSLKSQEVSLKEIYGQSVQKLLEAKGLTMEEISKTFKISPQEFKQFAERAKYVEHNGSFLVVERKAYNQIFHNLFTHLTSNSLPLDNINSEEIYQHLYPNKEIDPLIYNKALSLYLQPSHTHSYSVPLSNIIRYILSEMGELKREYLKKEFDEIFNQMVDLYTPAGIAKQEEFPQISECFVYVKEHDEMYYYEKLSLPTTIKQLIGHIAKIKKKYTYEEIEGLMGHLFPAKSLQEAIIKHFRKFGILYELKALSGLP